MKTTQMKTLVSSSFVAKASAVSAFTALSFLAVDPAQAAILFQFEQQGNDVIMTSFGSINTTGLVASSLTDGHKWVQALRDRVCQKRKNLGN